MAKVICPHQGSQLTLQSWTTEPPAYVIHDGPHRIISADGHLLGQPYEHVITVEYDSLNCNCG